MKLTQSNITAIKPNGQKQWISDDSGETRGLKLYVGPTGVKIWYFVKRDSNRKVVYRKIGPFPDLSLAEAREQARILGGKIALKEDIKREKPAEKMKLSELIDSYEKNVASGQKSGVQSMYLLRSFVRSLMNTPIDEITPDVIETLRQREKRDVKGTTFNKRIGTLRTALSWGVDNPNIPLIENPLARLRRQSEHDNLKIMKFLSNEEISRLFAALDDREDNARMHRASHEDFRDERGYEPLPTKIGAFVDYLKPLIIFAVYTGARRGSIFSLEWRNVDFDAKKIYLRPEASKTAEAVTLDISKSAPLLDTLEKWRDQCDNTRPNDLVFPSPKTGKRFTDIKKAWHSLTKTANLSGWRFHDLRHYFGSTLANSGIHPLVIKSLMGHKNLSTTERYAHVADKAKTAAMEALANAVPTRTPTGEQQDNIRHISEAARKMPRNKSTMANTRKKSAS
ncbi:MAG: site-specific integrase [Synergistaceae bacterium]|nr:site-specific integrase [Synergistaceae bacterium]